jgi:crossover junction endodeoxyribonuclease RuvC
MADRRAAIFAISFGLQPIREVFVVFDRGTNIMGYGVIKTDQLKLNLIQYGVIHLNKYSDHGTKLKMIFDKINELINDYKPDEISIKGRFYRNFIRFVVID